MRPDRLISTAALRSLSGRHCLHDGTRGWTYREVRGRTHRVANGLWQLGLDRGSKAAVYGPSHAAAYACLLGIVRAGVSPRRRLMRATRWRRTSTS